MIQRKLTINKIVHKGFGIAFHDNETWFVPYTLPGEECLIEEVKKCKKVHFGRIVSFIKKSPLRTFPECPNFTQCGGCSFLHCSYNTELDFKTLVITDSLQRIAKLHSDAIPPIKKISADRFHYRSSVTAKSDGLKTGLYRPETNSIVPFPKEGCYLLDQSLIEWSKNHPQFQGEKRIVIGENKITTDKETEEIIDTIDTVTYHHLNMAFFQTNIFLRSAMLNEVKSQLQPGSDETLLDAGCGCGFFALYLSGLVRSVHGFDTDQNSIQYAKKNNRLNKADNTSFSRSSFKSYSNSKKYYDLITVDPPRSGLDKEFIQFIISTLPERIVYISCEPSSFARDLLLLSEKYSLKKLTFIDMFPATYHIETIALLVKI